MSNENLAYRDNVLLKRTGVSIHYTQEQAEEYARCSEDPVYFSQKYIKIVNLDEGIIPFRMWDWQKDMMRTFANNRFCITKIPRQSGKTTISVAYILWLSIFTESMNIAILANKGQLARDILAKYQLAYENLPIWMQQGIIGWNKGSIELENGSKIIAAATSSSAIRGGSYNLVFLDEFAHVPNNMAQEFFDSVYPVISSGKTTKIIIVSTPKGMNMYYKLWMDAKNKRNNYIPFEVHWSQIPGRDEEWKTETIRNTSERQFQQEFSCEFIGSSNTLISPSKLQYLVYVDPIEKREIAGKENILDMYEQPVKGDGELTKDHLYAIVVDVSEGKDLDASAFSVIDISTTPYKQVAKYSSTIISPILYPTVIYNTAKLYNDAYVLVEINNTPQIADTLQSEFEYENLLKVVTGNKRAQTVSAGFGRGVQYGVKMSPLVKRMGCSNLKELIEQDKLLVQDFATISELTSFVAEGNSWAAEEGKTDDLVMSLVIFAWLTTQKYFREIVNHDLRKQLQLEKMHQLDEETVPGPVIDDGLDIPFIVEGGDVWVSAETDGSAGVYSSYFKEIGKM